MVTAIIASFNRRSYIRSAIDSVLLQTYPNFELIVIDDGSTDGTGELLQKHYGDRIRYAFQENKGRSEARNHGIRLAQGEYIAFLDSDDVWESEKVARQVAFMDQNPEYGLSHTFTSVISASGDPLPADTFTRLRNHSRGIQSGYSYGALTRRCIMFLSTVMVRSSLIPAIGFMDREIPAFEDWDWYLRAALVTKIGTLSEALTRYRLHEGNSTNSEFLKGERMTSIKHLELSQDLPQSSRKRTQTNLFIHLAAVAYKEGNDAECARFLRRAAQIDPSIIFRSDAIRYALTAFGPRLLIRRVRHLKRLIES